MKFKDYYHILGVSKNATEQQIKSAYRKLARQYHPDLHPEDKKAEQTFKQINEAYEVLGDSDKRRKYDELGSNWEQILRDQEYARQYAQPGSEQAFTETFNLGDFFTAFFGEQGSERGSSPERGPDVDHTVQLTLEEVYHGVEKRVTLAFRQMCAECHGTGIVESAKRVQGRRKIIVNATRCSTCHGLGRLEQRRSVDVKIPKDVTPDTRMRLAGAGGRGFHGGPRGDLYLSIQLQPHRIFRVEGNDLVVELPILDYEAALGSKVRVPTLDGPVTLTVPAGTQNGTHLRLKGKGLPHSSGKGDLRFRINIVIPDALSESEKEILRQLRSSREQRGGDDPRRGLFS